MEDKPIMGYEMVAVRGWGLKRAPVEFATMYSGDKMRRYYTVEDLRQLVDDMLSCAEDWRVGIHWSIVENYAEQLQAVEQFRVSKIRYEKNG